MERGRNQSIVATSDGFTMAIELVATTVLFGLLGAWLDGRFGTRPLLTALLGAIALGAQVVKLYYGYAARMVDEQRDKPWGRPR